MLSVLLLKPEYVTKSYGTKHVCTAKSLTKGMLVFLKVERSGSFQVDHELELGGQHDREICGLVAVEDPANIDADLMIQVRNAGTVAR